MSMLLSCDNYQQWVLLKEVCNLRVGIQTVLIYTRYWKPPISDYDDYSGCQREIVT